MISAERLVPEARFAAQTESLDSDIYIGIDYNVDLQINEDFRHTLTDTLNQIRAETPNLRSVFDMNTHDRLVRSLDIGATDIGFFWHYAKTVGKGGLVSQILSQDKLVLVVRSEDELPDNDETVRDILSRKGLALLTHETRGMGQVMRLLGAIGAEPHIKFCKYSVMMLSAESGECATILQESAAARLSNPSMRYLHFDTPEAARYLLAVWKRGNHNALVQRVMNGLAEKFVV